MTEANILISVMKSLEKSVGSDIHYKIVIYLVIANSF